MHSGLQLLVGKKALDEEIHKGILNIVEDARIEKKIKRKYPGIVRPFLQAYASLYEKELSLV